MANTKAKVALFCTSVVVGIGLIIVLVVDRSLNSIRICREDDALYFVDPVTNLGSCDYKAGLQGPCGPNMVLELDRRNGSKGVGVCECDTKHFDRAMIYHEERGQCYFIFTQAYCDDGMWLTVKRKHGPSCTSRRCPDSDDSGTEQVPLSDGHCVPLGKHDSATCRYPNQTIQFHKSRIYPACKPVILGALICLGVPAADCPQGYFSTDNTSCQPDFDFD